MVLIFLLSGPSGNAGCLLKSYCTHAPFILMNRFNETECVVFNFIGSLFSWRIFFPENLYILHL